MICRTTGDATLFSESQLDPSRLRCSCQHPVSASTCCLKQVDLPCVVIVPALWPRDNWHPWVGDVKKDSHRRLLIPPVRET